MNEPLLHLPASALLMISAASTNVGPPSSWSMVNWWPVILSAATGAILGWLSTLVLRNRGFRLAGSLVVGVLGGFLGLFLYPTWDHGAIGPLEAALRGLSGGLLFLMAGKVLRKP